jgi:hypothetical protein
LDSQTARNKILETIGGHVMIDPETQDRYAIELECDRIADQALMRPEKGVRDEYIMHMKDQIIIVTDADGVKKFIARDSGKPMLEHTLTDYRAGKPQMWHTEAPPDLARDGIVKGNITALGRLVSAIGTAAAEAECKKRGTTLADLYRGKRGRDPDDIAPALKVRNTNPFSADGWNLAKQRSLVAAVGIARANSIAASADPPSYVGCTAPGKPRLIPR